MEYDQNLIADFKEKPHGEEDWINGRLYVLQHGAIDDIAGDETIREREFIERLTCDGQLMGYAMIVARPAWRLYEKNYLEDLWQFGKDAVKFGFWF